MFGWIIENLPTIIALVVLAGLVTLVIIKLVRDKKKGKNACGCDCGSCPHSCMCHGEEKHKS